MPLAPYGLGRRFVVGASPPYPEAGRPASAPETREYAADGVIRSRSGCSRAPGWLPFRSLKLERLPLVNSAVELLICMTCKRGVPPEIDAPRPGAVLLHRVSAGDLPEGVTLRGVECLSNCSRGCTVALRGAGRWSYVYGDIDPELHLSALLEGAAKYHATVDGLIPWRERPEILRKGVIARIPPMEAK